MIPGHEIDQNLPLRKFFTDLVKRAVELSRSDVQMRRILNEFGDATGFDFKEKSFENLSRRVLFKSEISKDIAYGILDLQHFVEFVEYVTSNPEGAKVKGLNGQFADEMETAHNALNKLARYGDGIALETFDFNHAHTTPFGQDEPTPH